MAFCGLHVNDHQNPRFGTACKPESLESREKLYLTDLTDTQDPVEESCPPQH